MRAAACCFLLVLAACPGPSLRRPADQNVNLTGTVYLGGAERRGDPLEGATLTVTRASDGMTLATAVTSATGGYRASFAAAAETRVVLGFRANGFVPNFRALVVGPYTEAQLSIALEPPEALECTDNQCVGASDDLALSEVPDHLAGRARVFEPATETPRLTGLELYRPVVVAWYQLDAGPVVDAGAVDADAGVPPDDGGSLVPGPPVLRVRVPFVAWRKLEAVDVPFVSFDEGKGTWSKEAVGTLQTEYGLPIPASALPKIRDGQYPGGVVASVVVTRPGYWALALPAASPGCLTGTAEAEGQPAEGALISLEGSEPAASKKDGTFCLAAPLGGGGVLGVQYAGFPYAGTTVSAPAAAGTCGGTCTAVGKVPIAGDPVTAKVCTITGKTVDGAGSPVTGAVVLGFDESIAGNSFNTLCGKLGTRCTLSTSSDEKGDFTLKVPLQSGITVVATALVERPEFVEASRKGTLLLRDCPTGALQLRMLAGRDALVVALTLTGNTITWTPARPAVALRAIDAMGAVKWELEAVGGLASPVTYGMVPAGAAQVFPAAGAPAALKPTDEVTVVLSGTGGDGYQYRGSAAATVP